MLTVVPTSIGNLADMTYRAVEVLKNSDLIASEDTRHTGQLLKHYEIITPQISFHEHNEVSRVPELVARMQNGLKLALVSDAGTPSISDPGFRLVRATADAGIPVTVLPGACAAITALVGSALPSDHFCFAGFIPQRPGRRLRAIQEALEREGTTIFYESPYRVVKALEAIVSLDPERKICTARELTKIHEEYNRGTARELLTHFSSTTPRGEFCILIEGKK